MDPKEIYDIIKEKIIWLVLEPEKTLNLTELADSFSVSRNPVTVALTYLQAEGWVLKHGTHFMVSPLSLDRIKGITETRLVLEVQSNVWAMQRITPEEVKKLYVLRDEILKTDPMKSHKRTVELDSKFHNLLFRASKNMESAKILEHLLNHYLRFFLSTPLLVRKDAFPEILDIIQAIEKKDEKSVRSISEEHIKGSVNQILSTF
jgi:DNA-binding GntR family transcriptional regulator